MQPIEILSQLDQFKLLVNHDINEESVDFKLMLEKTLDLINIYESNFLSENKNLNLKYSECNKFHALRNSHLQEISEESKECEENLSTLIENEARHFCQEHCCSGKISITEKQQILFV